MGSLGDHQGRGGGGGTSCPANDGAYGGGGRYQSGGAGGTLHSPVVRFHDMLRSHSAELTPGVAVAATAIPMNATATTTLERRTNHLMVGLPWEIGRAHV